MASKHWFYLYLPKKQAKSERFCADLKKSAAYIGERISVQKLVWQNIDARYRQVPLNHREKWLWNTIDVPRKKKSFKELSFYVVQSLPTGKLYCGVSAGRKKFEQLDSAKYIQVIT